MGKRKEIRKQEERRGKRKFVSFVICIFFLGVLVFSGNKILKWSMENQNTKKLTNEITKSVIVEGDGDKKKYSIDFDSLKKLNSDVVGWLKVQNTNVEYPILKTNNNDFYLTHSFDKSYNSAGWIFADYRNKFDGNDKNIIIYGHNRRDGSMFSSLKNALQESWYSDENNRKIVFETEGESCVYEIFSIYQIEKEDYYIQTGFSTDADFQEFLNTVKKRSVKDLGVEVTSNDRILTLSTCGNNNNYRVVIHAKKVENNV